MLTALTATPVNYCDHPSFRLADHTELPEVSSTHQFNENAVRHVRTLTQLAGLERTGLHIARLTKGCESTEHHTHTHDEEFLVVL